MKLKTTLLLLSTGFVLQTSLISCKKTIERWQDKPAETVRETITARADNRIVEYKVENFTDLDIKGAIDDEKKTITIYLPHYSRLEFLETAISLPQGASISPAADVLVPVFPTTPFKYTVTGKSGQKAEYTVKVVVQQPEIILNELSTPTATKVINIASAWEIVVINGQDLVPAFSATSLYFLDKDGKEVYKVPEYLGTEPRTFSMSYVIDATGKATLQPATDYWLEVRSYAVRKKMQLPVRIIK